MNGWKNYETWNVVLWLGNDKQLHQLASRCRSFAEFRTRLWAVDGYANGRLSIVKETPDGVSWHDPRLDLQAIAEWWNDTFPMLCRKRAKSIEEFDIPNGRSLPIFKGGC